MAKSLSLYQRPWIRISAVLLLVCTALLASYHSVQAAGTDEDGIIEEDETIYDDVILNAENVRVDGTVEGNLMANGNIITINGRITGDAFLFGNEIIISEDALIEGNLISGGQTIRVAGKINGSLAAGSSSLTLEPGASVLRNVYYGGFSLEVNNDASIGVDLFSGNYQFILDGTVGRDLNIGAAAVEINGTVGRNANLDLGEVASGPVYFPVPPGVSETIQPGLRVDESATIGGDLKYTISVDQSSSIHTQPEGEVIFQTPVPAEMETQPSDKDTSESWWWVVSNFVTRTLKNFWKNFSSLLAVGALVIWLLPSLFKRTVDQLRKEPLPSAGFGVLTVILGYIALFLVGAAVLAVSILLSFISAGGLHTATFGLGFASLTMIGTVFSMLIMYGSKIVVSYLLGNWILTKLAPESQAAEKPFWGMALGVLIYSILRVIPFFGWVMAAVVVIFGVGAMWLLYRNRNTPAEPTAVEPQLEAVAEG